MSSVSRAFLFLSCMVLWTMGLASQNNQQSPAGQQPAATGQRAKPGVDAQVAVKIPYRRPKGLQAAATGREPDGRAVRVWRCDLSTGKAYMYFHEPLWALVEQASPIPNFPSFVRDFLPGQGPEGADLIEVELELSSVEFLELVRRTIMESKAEKDYMVENGFRPENTIVKAIVLNEVSLRLTGAGGHELLGSYLNSNSSNWVDRAVVHFVMLPGGVERLKRLGADEMVQIDPLYTFDAFETGFAKREFSARKCARVAMTETLDASQLAGTGDVTQEDKAKIEQAASAVARSVLRVSHYQMIGALGSSIGVGLMDLLVKKDLGPDDFKNMNPEVAKALAERIKPLVKKVIESNGGDSSTVQTELKEKGRETTVQGGVSVGVGPVGISGGVGRKWSDKEIQQLEKASGIHFEKSAETGEYVAQEAHLFTVREGWQEIDISVVEMIEVPVWQGAKSLPSTLVPQTFTASAVKERSGKALEEVTYHGVPLWVPLPYFGDTLPNDSYVWMDGKFVFPNEPWVPAHLRGKVSPDMSDEKFITGTGAPIGSSAAVKELNTGTGQGRIEVQAVTGLVDPTGHSVLDWMLERGGYYTELDKITPSAFRGNVYLPVLDPKPYRSSGAPLHKFLNVTRDRHPDEWADCLGGPKPGSLAVDFGPELFVRHSTVDMLSTAVGKKGRIPVDIPAQTVPATAVTLPPHVKANYIIRIR